MTFIHTLIFVKDSNTSTGRQLLSGGPWETCGYELDHGHYVFMLPYVFLTFLCFIGKCKREPNLYVPVHVCIIF